MGPWVQTATQKWEHTHMRGRWLPTSHLLYKMHNCVRIGEIKTLCNNHRTSSTATTEITIPNQLVSTHFHRPWTHQKRREKHHQELETNSMHTPTLSSGFPTMAFITTHPCYPLISYPYPSYPCYCCSSSSSLMVPTTSSLPSSSLPSSTTTPSSAPGRAPQ